MNYNLDNLYYVIGDPNFNLIDYTTKNPNVADFYDFCSLKSIFTLIKRSTSIDNILANEINKHEIQFECIKTNLSDHFQTFPIIKEQRRKMVLL